MIDLSALAKWASDEFQQGNRVKASKIYRVFCKYVRQGGENPRMMYEVYTSSPPSKTSKPL